MKEKVKNILIIVQAVLIIGSFSYAVKASGIISSKAVYYANGKETVKDALDKLTVKRRDFETGGDATEYQILDGKTLFVKGEIITGKMNNYSGQTLIGN